MKILLTGCFGFIGSNLLPELLNDGHQVIGFDNLSNPSINPTHRAKKASGPNWDNFKFYKVDIRNGSEMQTILAGENVEAVIHLAAVGSVPRSFLNPALTCSVNDLGFVNLLQTMGFLGIKRIVFASSSSVYGDNQEQLKTEGQEGEPLSPYALSKQTNEKFIKTWAPIAEINYVGLRFFNVYGPGQVFDSPYASVIPKFLTTDKPVIYGDGEQVRDFTYVLDVVEAIKKGLKATDYNISGIFNVGYGVGVSLNQLAWFLDKGSSVEHKPERAGDIRFSIANTAKAKEYLGFEAKYPVVMGLAETKKFYESIEHVREKENARGSQVPEGTVG